MEKNIHFFIKNDHEEVGAECIFKKLPPIEIKQKLDQVYYCFNCVHHNIELQ